MFVAVYRHNHPSKTLISQSSLRLIMQPNATISSFHEIGDTVNFLHQNQNIDLIILEELQEDFSKPLNEDFYKQIKEIQPNATTIMITNLPFTDLTANLKNPVDTYFDHIIGDLSNPEWSTTLLRSTLTRLNQKNIFQLSNYYFNTPKEMRKTISDSQKRHEICTDIEEFFAKFKLSTPTIRGLRSIGEELIMNAIYDAPLSSKKPGRNYSITDRTSKIELEPKDAAKLICCYDGRLASICVEDPFGGLTRSSFFKYSGKITRKAEGEALIDTKMIGAGLGLYKILHLSHSLICAVSPERKTQSLALIDTSCPVRDFSKLPRTIQFFEEK